MVVVVVGAADEADTVPHLSRPKLVPAGRVPELGWPWGLCTVAVKGSHSADSRSLSPGALSRDLVAGVRELRCAIPGGPTDLTLSPQRPNPALFLILTSMGTPGSI